MNISKNKYFIILGNFDSNIENVLVYTEMINLKPISAV